MDNKEDFIYGTDDKHVIKWTPSDEQLLKEWADHAVCYKWLHEKAHLKYNKIYTQMNIPIIIISTITGTANFAQSKISDTYTRDIFAMVIGALSIITGIIATIATFFKIAELKENHLSYSKMWDKFYRNIQVELSKPPSQRNPKKVIVELYKKEYDRHVESSPIIPEDVANNFKTTFPNLQNIKKPYVLDHIQPITITSDDFTTSNQIIDQHFLQLYGRLPTDFEKSTMIELSTAKNVNMPKPIDLNLEVKTELVDEVYKNSDKKISDSISKNIEIKQEKI